MNRVKTNDFQLAQNDDFRMLVEAREKFLRSIRSSQSLDVSDISERVDALCVRMSERIKHAAKLGIQIG